MKEPYDYLVYGSNLESQRDEQELSAHLSNLGITMRRIPPEIHSDRRCMYPNTKAPFTNDPTTRTSDVLLYMLRDGRNFCSSDYLLVLDADCFLTQDFYASDYLSNGSSLAAIKQSKGMSSLGIDITISYFWTPLIFLDWGNIKYKNVINFDCGYFDVDLHSTNISISTVALDASGRTFEWLMKASPKVDWLREAGDSYRTLGINDTSVQELIPGVQIWSPEKGVGQVAHIRDASGWMTGQQKYETDLKVFSSLKESLNRLQSEQPNVV